MKKVKRVNLKDSFWNRWLKADCLDKVKLLKSLPLLAELPDDERHMQATVANSYLADLADYLVRKGRWINKREQKPPLDTPVLLFVRYRYGSVIYIGEYILQPHHKKRLSFATSIRRYKDGSIADGFPLDSVTHWMPLPEPPPTRRRKND